MSASTPPVAGPQTASSSAESSGLQKVMWFGVLQLVGLISGWIGALFFVSASFSDLAGLGKAPNPTPAQVGAAMAPLFRNLSLLVPTVTAIQVAALVVLIVAFRDLKAADARFSTPSLLTIVLLIGSIIAVAGFVPLFNYLPSLIGQAPANPAGSSLPAGFSSAIASAIGYLALISLGGILALIGLIGGQILGLWRAGSKYNEILLKLGAIFAVIPLLNIIAPVLVIVGANQAKSRLATLARPTAATSSTVI